MGQTTPPASIAAAAPLDEPSRLLLRRLPWRLPAPASERVGWELLSPAVLGGLARANRSKAEMQAR
jgi:hypothetical protein